MKTENLNASTKEEVLFGEKARTAVMVDIDQQDLDPRCYYCVIPIEGDCMDNDRSPMRIKDGDCLLIHQIPLREWDIMDNVKKIVCFIMDDGKAYVKQLVFWDGLSWGIVVKMFNPVEQVFFVPLKKIRSLFVVDKVFSPEYIQSNSIPIKHEDGK